MRAKRKQLFPAIAIALLALLLIGCAGSYETSGTILVDGKEAAKLIESGSVVLIDAQSASSYGKGHIEGAVNIQRADIVKNSPVVNMLADPQIIEEVFSKAGIDNQTHVLVYDDNNNMDAARLWWTLLVYGHEKVSVVSGGLAELQRAGLSVTTTATAASQPKVFKAQAKREEFIATVEDVLAQVNDPAEDVCLLDTRTLEEFNAGTIPSSVHIDYADNNYPDGTYRKILDIRIMYKEAGIRPEDTVIMYCKTSIRGAQSFLALYDAGYRNLRLYDGAWVEWVSDPSRPVQLPETAPVISIMQDNS